jgi:P-type Mg2+ transporter
MANLGSVFHLGAKIKESPKAEIKFSKQLSVAAHAEMDAVVASFNSSTDGLSVAEAQDRLLKYGPNEVASEKRRTPLARLWSNLRDPLVLLLAALGVITAITGDVEGTIIITVMVVLGVVLRFSRRCALIMPRLN